MFVVAEAQFIVLACDPVKCADWMTTSFEDATFFSITEYMSPRLPLNQTPPSVFLRGLRHNNVILSIKAISVISVDKSCRNPPVLCRSIFIVPSRRHLRP